MQNKISEINKILFKEREKRSKPPLDEKSLTSWNGLMIKAYTDAYKAFNESRFLNIAEKNAEFILKNQKKTDGGLFHSHKKGVSSINGFLEDYAFVIDGFISLYEVSFDEKWIDEAIELTNYSIEYFFDKKSSMFFFTSKKDKPLITRKIDIADNVTPSSNSSLARSLFLLGHITSNRSYIKMSQQMLKNIQSKINTNGPSYSNWASLFLNNTYAFYEIVIVGKKADYLRSEIFKKYLPNKIIIGSKQEKSNLEVLENKFFKGETIIYVCQEGACQQPKKNTQEAITQIKY